MSLVVMKDQDIASDVHSSSPMYWVETALYNRAFLQRLDNMPRNVIIKSEQILTDLMRVVQEHSNV